MWLPRQVERVESSPNPVTLLGGEDYGAPFIIDGLCQRRRVAWFEFGPRTLNDPIAQGNALARAVNATLPTPLLGLALPLKTQLSALRLYRAELQPLWLVVTTHYTSESLIEGLIDLAHHGYQVVVDLRGQQQAPAFLQGRTLVLGTDELRLSQEDAYEILPRALTPDLVDQLMRRSGGRFRHLLAASVSALGLTQLPVPSAVGERAAEPEGQLVDPGLAVQALRRQGDLIDALELAVMAAPETVDDLIRQAGPRYQEEGLLERLHLLLSALPEEHARSERVLEWRMVAGFAASDYAEVLQDVDKHLAVHTAPALRARRAGVMRREQGFTLAEQAVRSQRSALTLWQYGRMHPDPATALALLRESVHLAEESGSRYDVVRNAGALVARLSQVGEFTEAASWARWTLDLFDRGEINEGTRRLTVVNDLSVSRIMTGDIVGLRRVLEDAQVLAEAGLPALAPMLRSTLAWLELAEHRPQAALELISATYHASNLRWRARQGYQLVRCLLELERVDDAAAVAADIVQLSTSGAQFEQALASLASGMVAAVRGQPSAADTLHAVLLQPDLAAEQRLMAALYFLLATDGGASRLPSDVVRLLSQVHTTGLRVLSGPESVFSPTWATLGGQSFSLRLRFLGADVAAVAAGGEMKLPQRVAEVALALALNPQGISRDALNAFLTPDGHEPFTSGGVRGMLTRVRSNLPVSDVPYRFTVPYAADVLDLREHLAHQRVRQAVALYRQPLLPFSEAPGVIDERERLEEELRQAVLLSRDSDALFELAERLGDDLETWSAATDALGPNDPRLAVARARVRRLEDSYAS